MTDTDLRHWLFVCSRDAEIEEWYEGPEGWEACKGLATWDPCAATGPGWPLGWGPGGSDFELPTCMCAPGHEHPHFAAYGSHPSWEKQRIVAVRRRARVLVGGIS